MKILKFLFMSLLTATLITSCGDDDTMDDTTDPMDMDMDEDTGVSGEIWNGGTITFTKADGADPADAANQDRINDNVWIARGNAGGQIFNAKTEGVANKETSPADTEWSLGTTADVADLTFAPFRSTIKPSDVVGKDLVLHLITDDIYIDIKFDSWSAGNDNAGGFSYTRSVK